MLRVTITQTAAPAIRRELGGSYADLEWISAAYTLAMSGMLLLGSRLGDIAGRRRVLLVGMGGFVAASVLCALAATPAMLIAARAAQGVLAAIMVPQGFGLIRELFGESGQQKALGVFGPVMGLAAVAGPLVGGALVNLNVFGTGWRMIFLVNVPLGLLAIYAGRRFLPRTSPATPDARPDGLSVALAMLGGVALVYPLVQGREHGWPAWCFAMIAAGVLILVGFAALQGRRSRQGRAPLVEPSVLRRRPYVAGLAVVVGFIAAMGGMMIALNVMYQVGLGFSPLGCAVATVSIPIAAIGGSIAMFDVILAGVSHRELGSAAGLLESVQQLAMSVGIAGVGTVLFDRLGSGHGPLAFMGAADHALLVAIAFLVSALAAVCWLPKHARAGAHAPETVLVALEDCATLHITGLVPSELGRMGLSAVPTADPA